ncbi:MAG: thermonuclease family protein [Planctomycetota bacterium]
MDSPFVRRRRFLRTTWVVSVTTAFLAIAAWGLFGPATTASRPAAATARVSEGLVSDVVDGDTFLLEKGVSVRLKGIDAPERNRRGYAEAERTLRDLVLGKRVTLSYDADDWHDQYDRLLAYIRTPEGGSVNERLLETGWAWIYRVSTRSKPFTSLLTLQRQAIEARRGVWRDLPEIEEFLVGNRSSRVVHRTDCVMALRMSPRNREPFSRLREAFWEGYSPCRECLVWPPGE